MRGHSEFDAGAAARPRGDRLTPAASAADDTAAYDAGRAGRPDVLGPDGLLRLQRAVGNAAAGAAVRSPVHDVVGSGGGAPLAPEVREDMEGRFGQDFSGVRVHTDSAAHDSAVSVNAQAYTVGENVVFQRDRYDPASPAGRHMLAHELTHVVQQRGGPVEGTEVGGGIKLSDPSDRHEREAVANADRVLADPPATPGWSVGGGAEPAVQRAKAGAQEAPEEEPAEKDTA
ncbi:MAG TPA: DUF4157 domain-containing protein [Pilimelia sp.]|nr:DUF4157 domain-containing protein [Pilimelia sp.]